jgi:hypothetical protein
MRRWSCSIVQIQMTKTDVFTVPGARNPFQSTLPDGPWRLPNAAMVARSSVVWLSGIVMEKKLDVLVA